MRFQVLTLTAPVGIREPSQLIPRRFLPNTYISSWFDHYFDNLSSKECHGKHLPCSVSNRSLCITQEDANKVYSMGQLEYDLVFSQADTALKYCTLRYGVFLWELIAHLRAALAGSSGI